MKNIKKVLALVLALVMLFAASACGKSAVPSTTPETKNEATPAPSTEAPQEVVEITYAKGVDVTPATSKIIETFNKQYEGKIKVNFVEMPSDTGKQHDQYVTSFAAGGSEYDIFDADVIWPAEFAQADYALALDKYVERDKLDLSKYMTGPVAAATFKGKLWAMPRFIDAGMFFYRTDIVDKAPETYDELIEMAKANKGKNGTQFGFVAQAKQYEGMVCNAVEYIAAYGGSVVDGEGNIVINSPETIKGLKKMVEIFTSDFVPSNITTFTEPESCTSFIEGQSVFIRNWPYQWFMSQDESQSKVVGKVAFAPLPKGDVKSASCLGGWLAMINKNSKNPDAAWEFLKFLAGPEGQKIAAVDGGLAPTYIPLYDDPDVVKVNPHFGDKGFVEGLKVAVPRPVSPIWPKLSEIMQIEISKALAGQQTVEEAVANMEQQMKAAVADAQ